MAVGTHRYTLHAGMVGDGFAQIAVVNEDAAPDTAVFVLFARDGCRFELLP